MSKSTRRLFADATALIEDMHGLAVEGQGRDVPPEMKQVLCRNLRAGARRLTRIIVLIDRASDKDGRSPCHPRIT